MSYDIRLTDKNGDTIVMDKPHHYLMGNMPIGGEIEASMNITYNYSEFFYKVIDEEKGIRWLYGKKAKDTIGRLESAIDKLGDDKTDNYWDATEGNAKLSIKALFELATMFPDGVWDGD